MKVFGVRSSVFRRYILVATWVPCFGLCSQSCAQDSVAETEQATLYVTVVTHFDRPWMMDSADLDALQRLTSSHPKIRWTHLYNPVAYTQSTPLLEAMEAFVIQTRDRYGAEIGVHLHMYESFVKAAGVKFRDAPSVTAERAEESHDPSGYAVPMTAYDPDEIRVLLDWTVEKFHDRNLGRPRSFCAGFYATSVPLQKAIVSTGFNVSAAAFPWGVKYGRKYAPAWEALSGWNETVRHTTRPYPVSAKSILPGGNPPYLTGDVGLLIEVPQTCKIDWMVSAADLKAIFRDHLELAQSGMSSAVCFAMHEQLASEHAEKFDDVLTFVDGHLDSARGVLVRYLTFSELRQEFLKRLPTPDSTRKKIRQLKTRGATVFENVGRVIEFRLNRTQVTDVDLSHISDFPSMTDLSLEETGVGDSGMAYLTALQRLEWLNLYRTRVGNLGLKFLSYLPRLQHLSVGETKITDAGLAHLQPITPLKYLGLRGNKISDAGLAHLAKLVSLTGLHLGETQVTDAGLRHLKSLTKLRKLWLHDTVVSNQAIAELSGLAMLEELYLYRTHFTIEGVRQLKAKRPRCRIFYRSATQSE